MARRRSPSAAPNAAMVLAAAPTFPTTNGPTPRNAEEARAQIATAIAADPTLAAYRCDFCGHEYTREYLRNWGENGAGDGYGPNPICTNITDDKLGRNRQVCRGPIVPNL